MDRTLCIFIWLEKICPHKVKFTNKTIPCGTYRHLIMNKKDSDWNKWL